MGKHSSVFSDCEDIIKEAMETTSDIRNIKSDTIVTDDDVVKNENEQYFKKEYMLLYSVLDELNHHEDNIINEKNIMIKNNNNDSLPEYNNNILECKKLKIDTISKMTDIRKELFNYKSNDDFKNKDIGQLDEIFRHMSNIVHKQSVPNEVLLLDNKISSDNIVDVEFEEND